MASSLEKSLRNLAEVVTGKRPGVMNAERVIQFIADNYSASSAAKGDDGVGIRSISGNIDANNKLTLTVTLTDNRKQVISGVITTESK